MPTKVNFPSALYEESPENLVYIPAWDGCHVFVRPPEGSLIGDVEIRWRIRKDTVPAGVAAPIAAVIKERCEWVSPDWVVDRSENQLTEEGKLAPEPSSASLVADYPWWHFPTFSQAMSIEVQWRPLGPEDLPWRDGAARAFGYSQAEFSIHAGEAMDLRAETPADKGRKGPLVVAGQLAGLYPRVAQYHGAFLLERGENRVVMISSRADPCGLLLQAREFSAQGGGLTVSNVGPSSGLIVPSEAEDPQAVGMGSAARTGVMLVPVAGVEPLPEEILKARAS